ncbi:MAG: DUF86 domain-containing protein [Deltaproteobacteria bacterium]|nr:DUF86 domain-containing protein [Deltaproteobacteria bacterium]
MTKGSSSPDLEEYESISLEDYRTNKKDQRFVERTLQLACECCLDRVAAHLVSRLGYREPRDNKDLFAVLSENQVITEPVHEATVKIAQFREVVVHDYARIDPEIVTGILRNHLADFKRFAGEVIGFIEGHGI